MGDTIVAAATAPGESGIGIVRLSGSQSVNIARRCFSSTETLGARPRFAELLTIGEPSLSVFERLNDRHKRSLGDRNMVVFLVMNFQTTNLIDGLDLTSS